MSGKYSKEIHQEFSNNSLKLDFLKIKISLLCLMIQKEKYINICICHLGHALNYILRHLDYKSNIKYYYPCDKLYTKNNLRQFPQVQDIFILLCPFLINLIPFLHIPFHLILNTFRLYLLFKISKEVTEQRILKLLSEPQVT